MLSKNEYNELGQLVDKKLHSSNNNATDAKQSVDYRYNIRGWLTSINNAGVTSDGQTNDDTGDLFGMELGYNTTLGLPGTTNAQYNGNISAIKWNAMPGTTAIEAPQKGYAFAYDPMNRLQKAAYKEKSVTWSSSDAFSEDSLLYDLNGNIQKLSRKQNGQQIDRLAYSYEGVGTAQSNRLLSVTDAADDEKGFKELNAHGNDYTYDGNGNLVLDQNKLSENLLVNGDFNSASGWTVAGETGRVTFQDGNMEIAVGASSATISQNIPLQVNKPFVAVIDIESSTEGTIEVKLGNSSANVTGTGKFTVTLTPVSSGSFSLKPTFGYAGKVKMVSVHSVSVIAYNFLNLPKP